MTFVASALRIARVSSQYAVNQLSERLAACEPVGNCQPWNGQDQYGRDVPYYSVRTLTAGHDPMQRIEIENLMRPNYQAAIHTGDRILNLDRQQYGSSFGVVDTSGMHRETGMGLNAVYGIQPNAVYEQPGSAFYKEAERFSRSMRRLYESNRYVNLVS